MIKKEINFNIIYKSTNYGDFRILKESTTKNNKRYVIVQFIDTGYSYEVQCRAALKGCVKDPFRPTIFNVGYIGNAHKKGNEKLYNIWINILSRCYNDKNKVFAMYGAKGCYVDKTWHNFETFLNDVKTLPGYNDMICNPLDKYELDKDYLCNEQNKCYSKNNCMWLLKDTNNRIHLLQKNNQTSRYCGVVYDKRYGCYQVQINFNGKQYYLGKYDSEEIAANVYNHYAKKLGISITLNKCKFISFEDCMNSKRTKRKLKIDSII